MLCLKEWLELDRIRTEVYEPALNETIAEMAVRKTARFFLESMEDEDDEGTPAELDDPFSGSEDAKPVNSSQEQEQERDNNEPESKMKIRLEDGKVITSEREAAKALKDAALWMRWDGMLKRREAVRQIQAMRMKSDPGYGRDSEQDGGEDDDISLQDVMEDDFKMEDAIPILKNLGYIDVEELMSSRTKEGSPEYSREQIDSMLEKAFYDAAEESGNEIPAGITDEQVKKNITRARKDFFTILYSVFAQQYSYLARSSRNTGAGGYGMKLYDAEELANKFILRMMDKVSKRPRRRGGLSPWGGLRSDKSKFGTSSNELEDDDFVDEILDHFKRLLYKEPAKAEDERRIALSPSKGTRDEYSNRDKKSSRINVDVKEALKDQAEGKTPTSLESYIDYLNKFKGGKEGEYAPESMPEKERFRFEIIKDVFSKAPRNPAILSLDPDKMIATLQNYRTYFLKRSKSGPSFMSVMGSKDDGSSWDAASPTDDERAYGRGAQGDSDSGISRRSSTPAGEVMAGNERSELIKKLALALSRLKSRNPKWAIAVCLKFGLNCDAYGRVMSPDKFLDAVIQRTSTGEIRGGEKTDCKSQLNVIGLSNDEVAEALLSKLGRSFELGSNEKATIISWVDKGLKFLCQELSKMFPSKTYVEPKFDSSRPPPLAGMIRKNQQ
jgi:hypothetical protein